MWSEVAFAIFHQLTDTTDDLATLKHYLAHFRTFQEDEIKKVIEQAVEHLKCRLEPDCVVFTAGSSQLVARTLSRLASELPISVVIVSPNGEQEGIGPVLAHEDLLMEAELFAEPHLRGKTARATLEELSDIRSDCPTSAVVVGAECVLPDGSVLHPRRSGSRHRQLLAEFSGTASSSLRCVISESYKVIEPGPAFTINRRLTKTAASQYDVLITSSGARDSASLPSDGLTRLEWNRRVDTGLRSQVERTLFS